MRAMSLGAIGSLDDNPQPLELVEMPVPAPGKGELLIRVLVCGVCHTELDEIEGRTPPPKLPVVLGHQVVGRVVGAGPGADTQRDGARVLEQVRDLGAPVVFGFTAAGADDDMPVATASQLIGLSGFGKRANLVDF